MAQEEERESAVNGITCSSTTTDQQKKKTRAKRNTGRSILSHVKQSLNG